MTAFTEPVTPGAFILGEDNQRRSRENITLAAGFNLPAGRVLGRIYSATGAAVAGNTGNGALTVGTTFGADVMEGVYLARCITAATNSGTFLLTSPTGLSLGQFAVGSAYATSHITITIADGATDFVVGDSFTITVAGGSYAEHNAAATDGTAGAAGVLYAATDATSAATAAVAIVRNAALADSMVTYKTGATATQKAAAQLKLRRAGITLRS